MPFKKFFRSLSVLLLASFPQLISYSCGPTLFPDDNRFALFKTSLLGNQSLVPFYFTHYYLNDQIVERSSDQLMNCEEWMKYTKNKAALSDIYYTQYKVSPDDFLYAYYNNDWSQFLENSFTDWLRKNKAALDYFAFAKKLEFQQLGQKDPWRGYDTAQSKIAIPVDVALQYVNKSKDNFLRKRYAFQAVKLAYYDAYYKAGTQVVDAPQVKLIYERELKQEESIVASWGLLYYGLSHTDIVERTKYLLLAFDKTSDKKQFVYNWVDADMLNQLESQTTDHHLLALITTMQAIKNPGRSLTQVQRLYSLEPNSIYLPLLICREVNKAEDWIWSPDVLDFNYGRINSDNEEVDEENYITVNRERDIIYLKNLVNFLNGLLAGDFQDKEFIRLALVHSQHMLGNYNEARFLLKQIPEGLRPEYLQQAILEEIINLVHSNDITEAPVQELLYQKLNQLSHAGLVYQKTNYADWEVNHDEEADDYAELLVMLSKVFQAKGEIVIAGLLYQKADLFTNQYSSYDAGPTVSYQKIAWFDRQAQVTDIDSLIAFKKKSIRSNFENFISPQNWGCDEIYLDLKGTKLLREKRYTEAMESFEQISDSFWLNNMEFSDYLPENSIRSVGTLLPVANPDVKQYPFPSKKLILQDLIQLQNQYANEKDADSLAILSFELGNCYYNISFWGKAWMMFSYGKSYDELSDWDPEDYSWAFWSFKNDGKKYAADYYKLEEAKKMYRQVLDSKSKNRELKAKAAMMLLVIEDTDEEAEASLAPLLRSFSDTRAYELALTYCPDFSDYVK